MKKNTVLTTYVFGLLLVLSFSACKPHKVNDISGQSVTILAPSNDAVLHGYTQTISWAKVDGAISYAIHIQMRNPQDGTFSTYVDSVVINNTQTFTYTFDPGYYEWTINARNGISQTPLSSAAFTMLLQPLTISTVILNVPATGYYDSSSTIGLSWHRLYGVDGYELEVSTDISFSTTYKDVLGIDTLEYKVPLVTEGLYYWRVRGYNQSPSSSTPDSVSLWSTANSFTYDHTPPGKAIPTKPTNGSTGNLLSGNLEWEDQSPDAASYYVYVKYGTADILKDSTSIDSYTYEAATGDTVIWQVQAKDAAGNLGLKSDVQTFVVQ